MGDVNGKNAVALGTGELAREYYPDDFGFAADDVRTLADVTPERVRWLWPGRFPLGKLVVLDGDPSTGKSTLTLDLAARVSTGDDWPDGAASTGAGDVLLLSAEDGLADTIAPRLHAARANLARVHALAAVPLSDDEGNTRMVPPSLPRDIGAIERVIVRHRVQLVVIDVLMAYLNGRVDSHRDQDVRGVLHQLAAMAERTGCTVLMVRHLNKAGAGSALYRGGGSIGIIGAARAAYLVARDPDDETRRVVAVTKSNLAAEPPSLAYRLVDDPEHGCARIDWETEPVDHTAQSLLRGPVDEDEKTERDEAAEFIHGYLVDNGGEAPAGDVIKAAMTALSVSKITVQRARHRAGARSRKLGMGAGWVWSLDPNAPRRNHEGVEDVSTHDRTSSTPSVTPSESHRAPELPDDEDDQDIEPHKFAPDQYAVKCTDCGLARNDPRHIRRRS